MLSFSPEPWLDVILSLCPDISVALLLAEYPGDPSSVLLGLGLVLIHPIGEAFQRASTDLL